MLKDMDRVHAEGTKEGLGDETALIKLFGPAEEFEVRSLFEQAKLRFSRKKHVHLYNGDSATVLPQIVSALSGPALFWLDAHYSGGITARGAIDTPIVEELRCILGRDRHRHVVLIDDARCFDRGDKDYPSIDAVRALILELRPDYNVLVEDDIIRAFPGDHDDSR